MSNNEKFNSAAAQAKEQATEFAAQAKVKADELIAKATPVVSDAAEKVGEYAAKAGEAAAGHVDGVAAGLKSATSGRGADKIDAFGAKLKKLLDPDRETGGRVRHRRKATRLSSHRPPDHARRRHRPVLGGGAAGGRARRRDQPGRDHRRAAGRTRPASRAGQACSRWRASSSTACAPTTTPSIPPGCVVDVLPPFAGG